MAVADKTTSSSELLDLCLWDIYVGCRASAERFAQIGSYATDATLRATLEACTRSANSRAQNISDVAKSLEGPENLWMAGILDDAERDTRTIEKGRLLVIALIGAIRKAFAAEQVSTKTALALSLSLSEQAAFVALSKNAWALSDLDAQLHVSLTDLTRNRILLSQAGTRWLFVRLAGKGDYYEREHIYRHEKRSFARRRGRSGDNSSSGRPKG